MFLFNLSLPEFLALVGAGSAVVVALYLLDRSRKSVVVSTLRFWKGTERQVEAARRKRVQQWPSLILQLAAIALLLLAIAQLRLGSRDTTSLDHVLLVDTSAWMGAQPAGERPLMEQARTLALGYLGALPGTDRVMVVYADAVPTPATGFEGSRDAARQAVMAARASGSGLNLADALRFAEQALANARRPGEVVLVGGGRPVDSGAPDALPKNFRLLEVKGTVENVGIRRIGLRPADDAANVWRILVTVANQGSAPRTATLNLLFGGGPLASQAVSIAPGGTSEAAFNYTTSAPGILEARLTANGRDDLTSDNQASVELAGLRQVELTVCSDQPRLLTPVLESLPALAPVYRTAAECKAEAPKTLAIYDGMSPGNGSGIVIAPPGEQSPIPVDKEVRGAKLLGWRPDHAVTAGLRSENESIDTQVFRPVEGDLVLGESSAGPVAVVHAAGEAKQLVLGFHPLRSNLRYQVAAPLLFANALRWLEPEAFTRAEIIASSVGMTATQADPEAQVRVIDERGGELPFSRSGDEVQFFTPAVGRVRLQRTLGGHTTEQVFSVALPDVPDKAWVAPDNVAHGIPPRRGALSGGRDIWYWLVLAAAGLLLADWVLFAPGVRRIAPLPGVLGAWLRRAA